MKNLLLMSLFGLSMTVAVGGKAGSIVSLLAPAYASGDSSHNDDSHDDESNNDDEHNDEIAFSCPEGVSRCYRGDGSEYIDVNNLSATAAGNEGDESHESEDSSDSVMTFIHPRELRSL